MGPEKDQKDEKTNPLVQALIDATNITLTENLAVTYASSGSPILDFYSMGGALRSRPEDEIRALFVRAFVEDPLLSMKLLFYIRDIRGGQGERRTFRVIINHIANVSPELIEKNFENVPFFGRWDDMYALLGTPIEDKMLDFLKEQIKNDAKSDHPSLLAKWLPSENTSSKDTIARAKKTRKNWGLTSREYRKLLSGLRKKLNIVERKMCANQWGEIDYEKVPSRASMIYRSAFKRHDQEGYQDFLDAVETGEKEIKTKTLYPYDMLRAVAHSGFNRTIELQWKNQPDWTKGAHEQSIVVCDTSGSMFGGFIYRTSIAPIYVATSLAIYFAERNSGPFKDTFITFSAAPEIQQITGENLYEKWITLKSAHWAMNTNLQAVFDLVLSVAKKNHISEDDMIKKIYIISDMEFDACVRDAGEKNFNMIKKKYAASNYEMPEVVFWNVESRQNQAPIKSDEKGVALVSGASPSIFETLMTGKITTPIEIMMRTLNKERYDRVII